MTHDEYMSLDPRTMYQIEKEKRATRTDEMTKCQLQQTKEMMDEGKEERGGRRKKK